MEDKQRLWDELLIEGWHKFWSVKGLHLQFFIRAQGLPNDKTVKASSDETGNFVLQFDLKRSYKCDKGEKEMLWMTQEVRALIASRSPRLSNCLYSGKHTDEAILEAIDRFPWNYKGSANSKFLRARKEEWSKHDKEMGATRTIKARTHTGEGAKSDWSKVK